MSKWKQNGNKLFPHLRRAWEGTIFNNIQIVKELTLETYTKTGLTVDVRINMKTYETGRKVSDNFKKKFVSIHHF